MELAGTKKAWAKEARRDLGGSGDAIRLHDGQGSHGDASRLGEIANCVTAEVDRGASGETFPNAPQSAGGFVFRDGDAEGLPWRGRWTGSPG